jgi:hypothetical protein
MASKIIFVIALSFLASVSAVKLECIFRTGGVSGIGNVYVCILMGMTHADERLIDEVTGDHETGMTNQDVEAIVAVGRFINRIPSNSASFFPNIISIEWINSNMNEIRNEDIRPFRALRRLNLSGNNFKVLDGNLFQNSPILQFILFRNCGINYVGAGFLENLNSLEIADFRQNICIDIIANTTQLLFDLRENLAENCPLEIEPEECPAGCVERIEALEREVFAVTAENEKTKKQLKKVLKHLDL